MTDPTRSTYSEKLKDPRWQKRRLKVFERDNFTCQRCLDKTKTLHLHHAYYDRGKDPWDADNAALVTLCEACHEMEKSDVHLKVREADARVVRVLKKHLFDEGTFRLAEVLEAAFRELGTGIEQEITIRFVQKGPGLLETFELVTVPNEASQELARLRADYKLQKEAADA